MHSAQRCLLSALCLQTQTWPWACLAVTDQTLAAHEKTGVAGRWTSGCQVSPLPAGVNAGASLSGRCTQTTHSTPQRPLPPVRYDLNNPAKHAKLDFLNNLATGLVFIIVVVNIFITAFGVQKPGVDAAPRQ